MNSTIEISVRSHPFFEGLKASYLALLTKGASQRNYPAGAIILKQGEPANEFFLIRSGSVALEAREAGLGDALVQVVGKGDVIGWSWLFAPFTWRLGARALEPVEVIALDGAHLLACAEENHDFGYHLMKRVAQMLIHRLRAARERLVQASSELSHVH